MAGSSGKAVLSKSMSSSSYREDGGAGGNDSDEDYDDDRGGGAHHSNKRPRVIGEPPQLSSLLNPLNDNIDWQLVLTRLEAFPQDAGQEIQTGDDTSEYPLFTALQHEDVPPMVISTLLLHYPEATQLTGSEGQHRALDMAMRCSPDVMDLVIKANPQAVREKWINGNVQLHYADNVANSEISRLLIQEYPESMAVVGAYGDTPLHWAVEYENLEVVRVILHQAVAGTVDTEEGDSILSIRNDKGLTPLDVACQMFAEVFKDEDEEDDSFTDMEECTEQDHESDTNGDTQNEDEEPDHSREAWRNQRIGRYHKRRWNIVTSLAKATFLTGRFRGKQVDFSVLHALVFHATNPDAIWFALRTNKRENTCRNSNGDTPLLIAASNPQVAGEVFDMLLSSEHGSATTAAMVDAHGRLPLHVAAESGRKFDEGIDTIIKAEPRAMETRDVKTAMYPFLLCAKDGGGDLDTVYRLVRETPSVLQHYDLE